MKKLIKNEICGSINSVRIHCSRETCSNVATTVHEQCMNNSRLLGKRVPKKQRGGGNAGNLNATCIRTAPKLKFIRTCYPCWGL